MISDMFQFPIQSPHNADGLAPVALVALRGNEFLVFDAHGYLFARYFEGPSNESVPQWIATAVREAVASWIDVELIQAIPWKEETK